MSKPMRKLPASRQRGAKTRMPACTYGMACKRRDCAYTHPTKHVVSDTLCLAYLSGLCQFGSKCRNRHVGDEEKEALLAKMAAKPCRFGVHCKTTGCLYAHPKARAAMLRASNAAGEDDVAATAAAAQAEKEAAGTNAAEIDFAARLAAQEAKKNAYDKLLQEQQAQFAAMGVASKGGYAPPPPQAGQQGAAQQGAAHERQRHQQLQQLHYQGYLQQQGSSQGMMMSHEQQQQQQQQQQQYLQYHGYQEQTSYNQAEHGFQPSASLQQRGSRQQQQYQAQQQQQLHYAAPAWSPAGNGAPSGFASFAADSQFQQLQHQQHQQQHQQQEQPGLFSYPPADDQGGQLAWNEPIASAAAGEQAPLQGFAPLTSTAPTSEPRVAGSQDPTPAAAFRDASGTAGPASANGPTAATPPKGPLSMAERLKLSAGKPAPPPSTKSGGTLNAAASKASIGSVRIPQELWMDASRRNPKVFEIKDPIARFHECNKAHSKPGVLDMHFQTSKTVDTVLDHMLPAAPSYGGDGSVWVITGSGHHTQQRLHKLFDCVQAYLDASGYAYKLGKDINGHYSAFFVRLKR